MSRYVIQVGFPGSGNLDVAPEFADDAVTGTTQVTFSDTVIKSTCELDTTTTPIHQLVEQSHAGRPIRVNAANSSGEIWGLALTNTEHYKSGEISAVSSKTIQPLSGSSYRQPAIFL